MPLKGLSIADGATSITVADGTAMTYNEDGQTVTNGVHVADTAAADFRTRSHISFRNINPRRLANGQFTLGTRKTVITDPYLDSAGVVHYCTTEVEQRYAVSIPAAHVKNNRLKAAQLLFDDDTEDFNTVGSLA